MINAIIVALLLLLLCLVAVITTAAAKLLKQFCDTEEQSTWVRWRNLDEPNCLASTDGPAPTAPGHWIEISEYEYQIFWSQS